MERRSGNPVYYILDCFVITLFFLAMTEALLHRLHHVSMDGFNRSICIDFYQFSSLCKCVYDRMCVLVVFFHSCSNYLFCFSCTTSSQYPFYCLIFIHFKIYSHDRSFVVFCYLLQSIHLNNTSWIAIQEHILILIQHRKKICIEQAHRHLIIDKLT